MPYEGAVQDLIDAFAMLPGVGPKSASRIAFHLIGQEDHETSRRLVQALRKAAAEVRYCERCHGLAEGDLCQICRSPKRDGSLLCVVEQAKDVSTIEKMREYEGLYHVLGGAISPLEGIGPDELNVQSLMKRLSDGSVVEVILATNPNLEGEATASYLARLLAVMPGVKVTRIARGVPIGGEIDYADELTLGRAFRGREVLSA